LFTLSSASPKVQRLWCAESVRISLSYRKQIRSADLFTLSSAQSKKFSGFGALNLLARAFPTGNKSALRICLLYQVLNLKSSAA
jgi:hypothetical protein